MDTNLSLVVGIGENKEQEQQVLTVEGIYRRIPRMVEFQRHINMTANLPDVKYDTLRKWSKSKFGVPAIYWASLAKFAHVTENDIYEAHKLLSAPCKKPVSEGDE